MNLLPNHSDFLSQGDQKKGTFFLKVRTTVENVTYMNVQKGIIETPSKNFAKIGCPV